MGRDLDTVMAGFSPERQEDIRWRSRTLSACLRLRHAVEAARTPALIMPVGPQASGKSTFRDAYLDEPPRPVESVSTDDLIEAWAAERGLNYSEAFKQVDFGALEKEAFASFDAHVAAGTDVYIDRTNLTPKSRRRWLGRVQGRPLLRVAIHFVVPEDVIRRRLEQRAEQTGKFISWHIVETAIKSMVPPSRDEGFDLILDV